MRSYSKFIGEQTVGARQLFDDYPASIEKKERHAGHNGTDKKKIKKKKKRIDHSHQFGNNKEKNKIIL